jgi:hypothetical protein
MSRSWIRFKQCAYFALSLPFRFDRWHYRVVRENCGYFARVREIHSRLRAVSTVEVGCGLGEVISGLDSGIRIGIDRDPAVIRAARFLRGSHIRFTSDPAGADAKLLAQLPQPACLVMLNWLHSVDPATALTLMGDYLARTRARFVLFDVIHPAASTYRYQHVPAAFAALGEVVAVDDAGDGIRNIVTLAARAPDAMP